MGTAPVLDGLEALTFIASEGEVDLADSENANLHSLDDSDGTVVEVVHRPALADLRQRLIGVWRVLAAKARRRGLLTLQDGINESSP